MNENKKADESTTSDPSYDDRGSLCLELALEGERLCKAGDCQMGVSFFQAAINAGTDDLRTLSAIYSQMGNAYFYLGDYHKAMQYHKHDLTLARSMGDKLGEAKSSGNLGNALKVMGKFDEAVVCSQRQLELSRELKDKLGEGRALYNLGNVYHAKAKHLVRTTPLDPGEYPIEITSCLEQAVNYYEENLTLVREMDDLAAQGRTCGNLGNTNYLLGHFEEAINYHNERLKIARQFSDKAGERRANSNLGNCYIFMGEFEKAAEHYKQTLSLAQQLEDRAIEAQACYSLGNTYTLLTDCKTAIDYHLRHYEIAQQLQDRVGEGRACWSLSNAYSSIGDHEKATEYAEEHLIISKELGDSVGEEAAYANIVEIQKAMGKDPPTSINSLINRVRRKSMERLDLIKLTPDTSNKRTTQHSPSSSISSKLLSTTPKTSKAFVSSPDDEESFFDVLSRFQSKRMDDQRCTFSAVRSTTQKCDDERCDEEDDLLDLIAGMQSKRMDEQRVELPKLPGLRHNSTISNRDESIVIATYHQPTASIVDPSSSVPDDDFFSLISRLQSVRMDDQRAHLKPMPNISN